MKRRGVSVAAMVVASMFAVATPSASHAATAGSAATAQRSAEAAFVRREAALSGVGPNSSGVETGTTAANKHLTCDGTTNGTYVYFSDSDRVGTTSGTFAGTSGASWLIYGNPNSIRAVDTFEVEGAAVGWSSPGSSWHVSGSTLTYDTTISGNWYNQHTYNIKATGFIGYYSHDISGTFNYGPSSCQVSTSASTFF